jgi:hypothetical protein
MAKRRLDICLTKPAVAELVSTRFPVSRVYAKSLRCQIVEFYQIFIGRRKAASENRPIIRQMQK